MQTQISPVLSSTNGQVIPLVGMDIEAKIEGLMTSVNLEQRYTNSEKINIEAVYTFPLPIDAVLTSLVVKIDQRILRASILEKKTAEARYEEAITDGNTVVMLEKLASGLYTMNVGNLMAGETIAIQMQYAFTQRWQGNQLRLFIPTTLAPRYGNDPFAAHQMPENDFLVEHACSFKVQIIGALTKAKIASPSHRISVQNDKDCTWINLQDKSTLMDKDFILNIESELDHNHGLFSRDREGFCALASFHPAFATKYSAQPKNFKILVDCSGSMGGQSIEQARNALATIVQSFGTGDFFNIVLFGSDHQAMFEKMMPATEKNIATALEQITSIDANLGGTEIGHALAATYQLRSEVKQDCDILLITDGEVWDVDNIIAQAKKSAHRIFTVGVGNAVSENFVRNLAEKTGGAAELVSPNENMADRIVRHFKRMRAPSATKVEMQWSHKPSRQLDINAVYDGDTVNVWAWFDKQPDEKATLVLHMPDGSQLKQELILQRTSDNPDESLTLVSRLAAAARIHLSENKDEIVKLACDYQLMSQHTNYLLVDVREQKAEDLPELRKVPHMLPEGWGGMAAASAAPLAAAPMRSRGAPAPQPMLKKGALGRMIEKEFNKLSMDLLEISKAAPEEKDPKTFAEMFANQFKPFNSSKVNIKLLQDYGLHGDQISLLHEAVNHGFTERQIAIIYLYLLYQTMDKSIIDRNFIRALAKAYKSIKTTVEIEKFLQAAIDDMDKQSVIV